MADRRAELQAQVDKFDRRLRPRPRSEIEAEIERLRAEWGQKVERYNYLLERRERCEHELSQLRPGIERYDSETYDLDFEHFRRLQLDGVVPALPRVMTVVEARYDDDSRVGQPLPEEGDDDGRHEHDFEVGSKG